jgi:hypothetical protein
VVGVKPGYSVQSFSPGNTPGVYGGGKLGVAGIGDNGGWGVYARNNSSSGGYAGYFSSIGVGLAGYFAGDVQIVGDLTKSSGSFQIDHPLDPENKYLYHSFVESPDMMNVYNGNVVLDASGEAWVDLPGYFEALNRDFRYQLTPIGTPGPNLYIAQEISGNRFKIAGGEPGSKVSWQVTGIRHDPYAERNRVPVEEDKPAEERGTYLHPEVYGQSETMGLNYRRGAADQSMAEPGAPVPERK